MDGLQKARQEIDRIDREMRELFLSRMEAVEQVSAYKRAHSLPVLDSAREQEVIARNALAVEEDMRPYYTAFLKQNMRISRAYQGAMAEKSAAVRRLHMALPEDSYDILIEKGILARAGDYLQLSRRVLLVTDDGVPPSYARQVMAQCKSPTLVTLPQGEASKTEASLHLLWRTLLENGFTRADCVLAVGGGVVGDLAGFAAATYMRGMDFYNLPTTLLSQVDSSIGGKTAIDFQGMKNIIGAFHQPRRVLIDPDLLSTLEQRQVRSGLAEVVKMAATCDAALFALLEDGLFERDPVEMIYRALLIKKQVVEADEKEGGLRRVLNFGHTLGHGIETAAGGRLLHGECVALGMLPMCGEAAEKRIKALLCRMGLPTVIREDPRTILSAAAHDKKAAGNSIWTVRVEEIGGFVLDKTDLAALSHRLEGYLGGQV